MITTRKKFSNAVGAGNTKYKSLLLAYGKKPNSGESLTLPSSAGFVKSSSASTNYSTVINMSDGKTPAEIANYVKNITFTGSSNHEGQTIQVTISDKVIENKTFYFEGTKHYYQFIPFSDSDDTSWFSAYDMAKGLTYDGRKGYLATITSFDEDIFIYNAADQVGWLGGTVLKSSGTDGNLYYTYNINSINASKQKHPSNNQGNKKIIKKIPNH